MRRWIIVIGLLLLGVEGGPTVRADDVRSPAGKVVAKVFVDGHGDLAYQVTFKDSMVVESSALGVQVDGVDLGRRVQLGKPRLSNVDESYAIRGTDAKARNHYALATFPLAHETTGRDCSLEFRLYDDGVAYRYIVPGEGVQHVDGERSSWRIMPGAVTWYFERLAKGWKLKSYAGEWISTSIESLHTASPVGPVQGTPLVFELPEELGYAAVTKAALCNYSGMRLRAAGDRAVVADFTEGENGFDVTGTVVTPWRVMMLADDLNDLVNSDLIANLNPAPDPDLFADVEYIRPGRCVWSWETLGLGTPETQRTFIDLAAELGFEYSLVDDGWKDWGAPWETVESLCERAKGKNVGVWVWVHSGDICDPADGYRAMRNYFARVAEVGVVGVKIDFMNSESKAMVDFEIAALQLAAERKLMINFHGCHASTGEFRTYPNEMTREGIRGIEVNKMKEGPLPASHNAALPFTRFLVGQADYTPILYTNPGPTTWAHQLATPILFDSPLQVYAEHPDFLMRHPVAKQALDVLRSIPTVWDETRVLEGSRIGGLAAMARRSGGRWFVGILNGGQRRSYEVSLDFLPEGQYDLVIVSDDLDAERISLEGLNQKANLHAYTTAVPFKVERRRWTSGQHVTVTLGDGGGCVLMLKER